MRKKRLIGALVVTVLTISVSLIGCGKDSVPAESNMVVVEDQTDVVVNETSKADSADMGIEVKSDLDTTYEGTYYVVNADGIYVLGSTTDPTDFVAEFPFDTEFKAVGLETSTSMLKVELEDGTFGWVYNGESISTERLVVEESKTPSETPSSSAESTTTTAQESNTNLGDISDEEMNALFEQFGLNQGGASGGAAFDPNVDDGVVEDITFDFSNTDMTGANPNAVIQ